MDKSAALERLTKLESEAAELRKIIEQPEDVGLWEPKHGGRYWCILAEGLIQDYLAANDFVDGRLWAHGNCFKTEPIARKASALQRKFNFYLQACFQADPDAGEWSEQRNWAVLIGGTEWKCMNRTGRTKEVCVHTEAQAREACRLLKAWQAKEDAK